MIRPQMLKLYQGPCCSSDNLKNRNSLTIYLQVAFAIFGHCPFLGYDSVVAGHLFAGAPIVFLGFVLCAGVVMIFGSFQVGNHLT